MNARSLNGPVRAISPHAVGRRVVPRDAASTARDEGGLADDVLLRICRVSRGDPQVTPEWMSTLRLVARLLGQPRAYGELQLETALTLLASTLGRLKQFNPSHLPFGYNGPRLQPREWIERDAFERVGKQIVGRMWSGSAAPELAAAVERAVTVALRLGFLEQRDYDAWRPGMPSGSGWRSMVMATPYGVAEALTAAERVSDTTGKELANSPCPSTEDRPSPQVPIKGTGRTEKVAASAEPPQVEAMNRHTDDPVVQLGRPGEPCVVLGKRKKPLTDGQYAVVSALLQAGEDGLNKDALEAIRPSARRILKRLRQDADWAEVVLLPGQTNGRYRIRA